ncbi:hypothetical protein QE418_001317 [Microbacterium testaceum]|nr:hypothetical protein [Microbacterium testaceum]
MPRGTTSTIRTTSAGIRHTHGGCANHRAFATRGRGCRRAQPPQSAQPQPASGTPMEDARITELAQRRGADAAGHNLRDLHTSAGIRHLPLKMRKRPNSCHARRMPRGRTSAIRTTSAGIRHTPRRMRESLSLRNTGADAAGHIPRHTTTSARTRHLPMKMRERPTSCHARHDLGDPHNLSRDPAHPTEDARITELAQHGARMPRGTTSAIRTTSAEIRHTPRKMRESLSLRNTGRGCREAQPRRSAQPQPRSGTPHGGCANHRACATYPARRNDQGPHTTCVRARIWAGQTPRVDRHSSRRLSCSTGSGTGSDTSRRLV